MFPALKRIVVVINNNNNNTNINKQTIVHTILGGEFTGVLMNHSLNEPQSLGNAIHPMIREK